MSHTVKLGNFSVELEDGNRLLNDTVLLAQHYKTGENGEPDKFLDYHFEMSTLYHFLMPVGDKFSTIEEALAWADKNKIKVEPETRSLPLWSFD